MKPILSGFFSSLLCLALTVPAVAEARPRRKPAPKPPEDFSVPVPSGDVDITGEIKKSEVEKSPVDYEISVSSWAPSNYTRKNYAAAVTDFKRGSLPFLSINRIAAIKRWADGDGFFWRVGLSYASITREGFSDVSNISFLTEQNLNMVFLRAGAEYRGSLLLEQLMQPYLGVALLPGLVFGAQSAFEQKVSEAGVPFEFYGGLLLHPGFMKNFLDLGDASLGVAAHYTLGSIGASSLKGFGVQGIVQISL